MVSRSPLPRRPRPGEAGKRLLRPYGDTTGDGMVQLSFTLPMPHSKVAEGAASSWPTRWGWTPRSSRTPSRWATTYVLRRLRAGEPPRRPLGRRDRGARLRAADAQGGQRGRQAGPAPPDGRGRRVHRHRRPHRRHRRDPQHQGVRGGEGAGVLPRAEGGQPRRPGLRAPAGGAGRRREGRRRTGLPGRDAARRPPAEHPRDVSCLPRGVPAGATAAAGRRRTAVRRDDGRGPRGRPRLLPGTTPGEVASYLVHRSTERKAS